MARIKVVRQHTTTRVVIAGRLSASDLRRLEHACAPALTAPRADLVLDLTSVSEVDNVALALLDRIESRGAIVRR
jgi:hypothetical protein